MLAQDSYSCHDSQLSYVYHYGYLSWHTNVYLLVLYIPGGGYFCKFIGDPSKCHMCYSTLCDPHTVTCCNKMFCKQCIVQVKQSDGQCPECGKDFKSLPCEELNEILQISGKKEYVYLHAWHADGIKKKALYSRNFLSFTKPSCHCIVVIFKG